MLNKFIVSATLLSAALFSHQAIASSFAFGFAGSGVSGNIILTYSGATDAKYSQAYEVTGISGTFSDSNNGLNIVNAPIGSLVALTHSAPEPTNLLAPADFSKFAVASGLPADNNGFISFDNLFYPGGSPQTASDYPFSGGFLDIYGVMFNIAGGDVVNFWSNGNVAGPVTYGVAVVNPSTSLDYVGGIVITPEPSVLALLGSGLIGMFVWRRRTTR